MIDTRVDLSVLRPFSPDEIASYLAFLRKNGETSIAAAVEAALSPIDAAARRPARSEAPKSFS